jgi:hypothetical protein
MKTTLLVLYLVGIGFEMYFVTGTGGRFLVLEYDFIIEIKNFSFIHNIMSLYLLMSYFLYTIPYFFFGGEGDMGCKKRIE